MNRYIITILLIGTTCLSLKAQNNDVVRNNDLWMLQFTKVYFNNGFGLENELHLRLADWGSQKQQVLIRPSIFYQYNENVTFHLGYTHIETYPYGEQAIALQTPENNFWVQTTLNHQLSGVSFSHRYRLEQRWTGKNTDVTSDPEIDGFVHRNRFRYRLSLKKALEKNNYLSIFDEVWMNFGENTKLNRFDQNWAYIGAGHKINSQIAIELGYLHQWITKSDGYHFESNNTIQLAAILKISKAKNY